jgi:hypothetical protein
MEKKKKKKKKKIKGGGVTANMGEILWLVKPPQDGTNCPYSFVPLTFCPSSY